MKKMDRILKEWIIAISVALLLLSLVYQIVWLVSVDGHSMEKTLYDNAIAIVYKLNKVPESFNKGDIVVAGIENSSDHQKVIKRIIGVQGDHVVIQKGVVMINGEEILEPYVSSATLGEVDLFVPRNGYYLLGDNRLESKDSRVFGCVDQKNIVGKVIYILNDGN